MQDGHMYENYQGPMNALTWDPCPFSQPMTFAVAHMVSGLCRNGWYDASHGL